MDAYWDVNGAQTVDWPSGSHPAPVDASRYLRPFSSKLRGLEGARLKRIAGAMKQAAAEKRIFHLWWHPEDFAGCPERNLDFLHQVLGVFDRCRRDYGMVSLSMGDVSEAAQARVTSGTPASKRDVGPTDELIERTGWHGPGRFREALAHRTAAHSLFDNAGGARRSTSACSRSSFRNAP
jgi:hypothetical protein